MTKIKVLVRRSEEKRPMSKPRLLRDIVIVVVAKLALVISAGAFVFGPANRPQIDAGGVQARLIGPSTPNASSRSSTP